MRRTLVPVLGVGIVRCGALVAFLAVRAADPNASALDPLGWLMMLGVSAISLAFLVGLLESRVHAAGALERVTAGLSDVDGPGDLRELIAEAIGDPSLEIRYASWREPGQASAPWRLDLQAADGRSVLPLPADDTIAAIEYDSALDDQRSFVAAVGACAMAALRRQQLAGALQASLKEVEDSRARIAAAADGERHRIERDLHDGAQQDLVTLRVKLALAAETLEKDPVEGRRRLAMLGERVDEILDQVRSLARGVYPPLLADAGLVEALRSAGSRATLPVTVSGENVRRYPEEVESAVYFCCLEALQNVAKHAPDATRAAISLSDNGALRFTVEDDGQGLPSNAELRGSGLANMRDRVAAVGGTLDVRSGNGEGTVLVGTVPLGRGAEPS
jgi:signal transduction histidine kinase